MKMEELLYNRRLKETQHPAVTNSKQFQKINAPNLKILFTFTEPYISNKDSISSIFHLVYQRQNKVCIFIFFFFCGLEARHHVVQKLQWASEQTPMG